MPKLATSLIAVDIGNSRIKLGRFDRAGHSAAETASRPMPIVGPTLPEPSDTLEITLSDHAGNFEHKPLSDWCAEHVRGKTIWIVGSVHRGAAERFTVAVTTVAKELRVNWPIRQLTYRDVPLAVRVAEPERVGIDRLLASLAANRIRARDRAAIVVDSGSAMTVDLVSADGAFCGGAILPGIAMAARALDEQTDALPRVALAAHQAPPPPLGTSTVAAIESGLFWGAVGAIRELVHQLSASLAAPPDVLLTGGALPRIAGELAAGENWNVRHVPHLVLAGIALVDHDATVDH